MYGKHWNVDGCNVVLL